MATWMRAPKLKGIEITDPLFGSYAALVADVIIPYQWNILNDRVVGATKSYCIENFRIAAGEQAGQHRGVVFSDTDAYKWLEAVSYCIENGSGTRFEETADELIGLIGRAQQPDGYLNTYFSVAHPEQRWTNLVEGHELYSAGYLIEAAVAYYNATGKDALLNIARRFADLICRVFGPDGCRGYPGHQEIEIALVKLWRVTGERRYLELSRFFIDQRGAKPNYFLAEIERRGGRGIFPELSDYDPAYSQTHERPVLQRSAEGHAVRALYMCAAMADLAGAYGDGDLETACRALWESVTRRRMYVTGGVGSSGTLERFTVDYDLPNDRMYCETCASIGLMMFSQRMAALTGEASYYDAVERALCNTLLAGISASGDRYFYVNPLEVWPANCRAHTALEHVKPVRQPWFDVACCPPNTARTLASLGQYIYAESEDALYINQFISSRIDTRAGGGRVRAELTSRLMNGGGAVVRVESEGAGPFSVRVRLPRWLEDPAFELDGAPFSPRVERGYAVLPIPCAGVRSFTLRGRVRPVFVAADPNVRADVGKTALTKGPFVYCLEEADNGENLAQVYVSPEADVTEAPPLPGLPGELPTLRFSGRRMIRTGGDADALYSPADFALSPAEFTAVPYCLWSNRTPGEMQVWQKVLTK